MSLYEVQIEETKTFVTHVEAEDTNDASCMAVAGHCKLIETRVKPHKIKKIRKLDGSSEVD